MLKVLSSAPRVLRRRFFLPCNGPLTAYQAPVWSPRDWAWNASLWLAERDAPGWLRLWWLRVWGLAW